MAAGTQHGRRDGGRVMSVLDETAEMRAADRTDFGARGRRVSPWREGLLTRVGYIYLAIFVGTVVLSIALGRVTAFLAFGGILGLAFVVMRLFARADVAYQVRAGVLVLALFVACAAFYLFAGLNPGPVLAFAFCVMLTAMLLGSRAFLVVLSVMVVFLIGVALAMWLDAWPGPRPAVVGLPPPAVWFWTTIVSALFWLGFGYAVLYVVSAVERNVERLREEIHERKAAEQSRRTAEAIASQAQKLEALGQLAAGIAHDFNNALLVLRGWTDLLQDSDDPELKGQAINAMGKAIDQSEQLARRLLTFGHAKMRDPRYLDIAEVVTATAETLRRVVPSNITLELEVAAAGIVFVDESQVQQMLFNLILNARDALPRGGRITVRCRPARTGEGSDAAVEDIDGKVLIEVEDDGDGMDEATKARVFEPFFTTKPVGKGTGLGLAMVFGIVRQSGSKIDVWSKPGHGTRFRILMPTVEVAPDHEPVAERIPGAEPQGLTVLVVEDDPLARDLLVYALRGRGFEIFEAANGDAALQVIDGHSGDIDLLCTDAVFPGANVADVIAAYERRFTSGRVLVCSGYVPEEIAEIGIDWDRHDALPKPFTAEQLIDRITSLLAPDPR